MGMSTGRFGLSSSLDDAKRDACLHSLGDHYAAGRLSADELDACIQAALAAQTEEDLAAVMAGIAVTRSGSRVAERTPSDAGPRPLRPRAAHRSTWIAAPGILGTGGAVMAAAGPGSNAAEFSAGLALGLLGFLTHWGLSTRSGERVCSCADQAVTPGAPILSDAAPATDDASDDHAVGEPSDDVPVEVIAPENAAAARAAAMRRLQGGIVPGQRTGD